MNGPVRMAFVVGVWWLVNPPPVAAAETLFRADWPAVNSGAAVTRIPALQRVMRKFERLREGVIVIRHPGGDHGAAWAEELRDWLVALGVASAQIRLEPGSGVPGAIVVDAVEHRVR